jgi:hypothetical protein
MVQPLNDVVKSTLVQVGGQAVERSTLAGLKVASAKSGVSFQYLVAKAAQESSLDPDAAAATSSASGLFQFTRGTWLEMMHRYGSQYGYGALAEKISVTGTGRAVVADAAAEKRLLDLREDPQASGLMAAAYAQDNAASLENALGRVPDAADLYLAHFLGASGAAAILTAAEDTPGASAAGLLPAAAKANRTVFYTKDGETRTAAGVVALVRERFTAQLDRFADVAGAAPEPPQAPSRAAGVSLARGFERVSEQSGAVSEKMIQMMVLEERARLIALSPMRMSEEEEGNEPSPALGTPAGFHGQDFAAAMMRAGDQPAAVGLPKQKRGASAYQEPPPLPNLDDLL